MTTTTTTNPDHVTIRDLSAITGRTLKNLRYDLPRLGLSPIGKHGRWYIYPKQKALDYLRFLCDTDRIPPIPPALKEQMRLGTPAAEILGHVPPVIIERTKKELDSIPDGLVDFDQVQTMLGPRRDAKSFLGHQRIKPKMTKTICGRARNYYVRDEVAKQICEARGYVSRKDKKIKPLFRGQPPDLDTSQPIGDVKKQCEITEKNPTPENVWRAIYGVSVLGANQCVSRHLSRQDKIDTLVVHLAEQYRCYVPGRATLFSYLYGHAQHIQYVSRKELKFHDRFVSLESSFLKGKI